MNRYTGILKPVQENEGDFCTRIDVFAESFDHAVEKINKHAKERIPWPTMIYRVTDRRFDDRGNLVNQLDSDEGIIDIGKKRYFIEWPEWNCWRDSKPDEINIVVKPEQKLKKPIEPKTE